MQFCENHNIKGRIYRTPVLYKQTGLECEVNYIELLTKRIHDFVKWVKSRIPNYFDTNTFNLVSKNDGYLHNLDVNSVIEKIVELEEVVSYDLFETYRICAGTKYSAMNECKRIFKDLYDVDADLTENISNITQIDKIFHKIYQFHFINNFSNDKTLSLPSEI